jgi:hypothetical protein
MLVGSAIVKSELLGGHLLFFYLELFLDVF